MTNLTDYRSEQIADEAARRLEQPELKPCPFCGRETWVNHTPDCCYIMCHHGDCIGSLIDATYKTEAEAIEAWNTRAERTCQAEYRTGGNEFGAFYCSACDNYIDEHDRYCPSCGAKVVEE